MKTNVSVIHLKSICRDCGIQISRRPGPAPRRIRPTPHDPVAPSCPEYGPTGAVPGPVDKSAGQSAVLTTVLQGWVQVAGVSPHPGEGRMSRGDDADSARAAAPAAARRRRRRLGRGPPRRRPLPRARRPPRRGGSGPDEPRAGHRTGRPGGDASARPRGLGRRDRRSNARTERGGAGPGPPRPRRHRWAGCRPLASVAPPGRVRRPGSSSRARPGRRRPQSGPRAVRRGHDGHQRERCGVDERRARRRLPRVEADRGGRQLDDRPRCVDAAHPSGRRSRAPPRPPRRRHRPGAAVDVVSSRPRARRGRVPTLTPRAAPRPDPVDRGSGARAHRRGARLLPRALPPRLCADGSPRPARERPRRPVGLRSIPPQRPCRPCTRRRGGAPTAGRWHSRRRAPGCVRPTPTPTWCSRPWSARCPASGPRVEATEVGAPAPPGHGRGGDPGGLGRRLGPHPPGGR